MPQVLPPLKGEGWGRGRTRPQLSAELDTNRLRLRHQRVDQMPVLDHVRERLALLDLAAEGQQRRAHRVVEF